MSFLAQVLVKLVPGVHMTGQILMQMEPHKQFVSSETDVTIFIKARYLPEDLPKPLLVDGYQVSEQLSRKKEAFAAKQVRDAF